jgi:hypothetical protein
MGDRSLLKLESKSEMFLEDFPIWQRLVKSPGLRLPSHPPLSWRFITGEVNVTESSTHSGHDLLKLLLLLVITLTVVVPLAVVILVGGGVELLPLGEVSDEVGGVTALKEPLGDLLLSL